MTEFNVTRELNPPEQHGRDNPIPIWAPDKIKLEMFAEAPGGGMVDGGRLRPVSQLVWKVRVKGAEYKVGPVTAFETLRDVKHRGLEWWKEQRDKDERKGT